MKTAPVLAMLILIVAACASPTPLPTVSAPAVSPTLGPGPGETALDLTVPATDWMTTCDGVPRNDCDGVATLFVNNLARSWKAVLDASAGVIVVATRSACPATLPGWADSGSCWQATAKGPSGPVCMVIARNRNDVGAVATFGQVGGDEMTGRVGGSPAGWPTCE